MSLMRFGNGSTGPACLFGISREEKSGETPGRYQVLLHPVRVRVVGAPPEKISLTFHFHSPFAAPF
jgi:hypothetical protein